MARLLLAAHDPGGAQVVRAGMAELRRRGHTLALTAAGPAQAIWQAAGEAVGEPDWTVDALVTGTSFHSGFDRDMWAEARRRGIPSVAMLDAWVNLDRRFADGRPDLVLLCGPGEVAGARTLVVGQPFLEQAGRALRQRRAGRPANPAPLVGFFSEPVTLDYPGDASPGYDQHSIFAALAQALPPGCRLVAQPHPREDRADWAGVELAASTADLLERADLVTGMSGAVLLEAALAGIPTLAVQLGRTKRVNPVIEDLAGIAVATDPAALAAALASLLAGGPVADCPFAAALDGSTRRFADAVDSVIG